MRKPKKYRIKQIKTIDGNDKSEDIFFIQKRFLFFWVRAAFNSFSYNKDGYADYTKDLTNFNTYQAAHSYLTLQSNIKADNLYLAKREIKVITAYTYTHIKCYLVLGKSILSPLKNNMYWYTFDREEAFKMANKLNKTKQTKIHNL